MTTTISTNLVFGGQAQSIIRWDRLLTDAELVAVRAKRGEMYAAGNFGSFPVPVGGVGTATWVTLEAAQAWVDFCNTFTPPPVSASTREFTIEDVPPTV